MDLFFQRRKKETKFKIMHVGFFFFFFGLFFAFLHDSGLRLNLVKIADKEV